MTRDDKLEGALLFLIEKVHKSARRHSQEVFARQGYSITIDQWLVLKKIKDSSEISQVELAKALFKDTASITRILSLLLKKKLITKNDGKDKRSYFLALTPTGHRYYEGLLVIVQKLRKQYIHSIAVEEQQQLKILLEKLLHNMK